MKEDKQHILNAFRHYYISLTIKLFPPICCFFLTFTTGWKRVLKDCNCYAENTKPMRQDHRALKYFHVKIKIAHFHNSIAKIKRRKAGEVFFRVLIKELSKLCYCIVIVSQVCLPIIFDIP